MGSFHNHLDRLTGEAEQRKNAGIALRRAFNQLHASIVEHIRNNVSEHFSEHNNHSRKTIFISTSIYTFKISSILLEYEQKIKLSVSEESIKDKILIELKFDKKRCSWKIRKISHKKITYTMRVMKPVMVEYFLIILTRYL
jgi:adenine C2-methylase RlmN of 23S rRNA A2503 and tRNA A37